MAKTGYLVPGVGSGQGLGEEGADVLDFSVSEKEVCKEIQPIHSKGDQPWVFFGRNYAKVKLQYFGHLM